MHTVSYPTTNMMASGLFVLIMIVVCYQPIYNEHGAPATSLSCCHLIQGLKNTASGNQYSPAHVYQNRNRLTG